MKNLHVVDNLIRQRRSIGSYDWGGVLSGFTRRKFLFVVTLDGAGAFDWLLRGGVCRFVCSSQGHERGRHSRSCCGGCCFGKEMATCDHNYLFSYFWNLLVTMD